MSQRFECRCLHGEAILLSCASFHYHHFSSSHFSAPFSLVADAKRAIYDRAAEGDRPRRARCANKLVARPGPCPLRHATACLAGWPRPPPITIESSRLAAPFSMDAQRLPTRCQSRQHAERAGRAACRAAHDKPSTAYISFEATFSR